MGLFSGSKKVYVSSSVYNMAGEEIDRPNFLKTNLFSAITSDDGRYLGESVVNNYLTGPGVMQRSFFNWSVRNDIAGLPTFSVENAQPIPQATVSPFIPIPVSPVGLINVVQSAELTDGDYEYWAEKWLFENAPEELALEWISDYNSDTHEITIQYAGGTTVIIPATNYDKEKKFIIARYYQTVPESIQPLNEGVKTVGVYVRPDTTGYTLESTVNTGLVDFALNQDVDVERVYSDGSPTVIEPTSSIITDVSFNGLLETWKKIEYVGSTSGADDTSTVESWIYIWTYREVYTDLVGETVIVVNDMGAGETETVTTVTTGEFIHEVIDHQFDNQETILDKITGSNGIWIYEIGTGNSTLDLLVDSVSTEPTPEYYPVIPLRINNESLNEPTFDNITGSGLYKESAKAYKKATGGPLNGKRLSDVLVTVEENESIGDIDFAYIQWGVSVNVFDPACRRYMYAWLKSLIPFQNTTSSTMADFISTVSNYDSMYAEQDAWALAQYNPTDPLYNTAKPPTPLIESPPTSTIKLVSDHPQLSGFDNRFTWVNITESNHTGLGKVDANVGDIWFEEEDNLTWNIRSGFIDREGIDSFYLTPRSLEKMTLFKQTGASTYSKLVIWGMVHENYIYGGKAVRTTLKEGVNDTEESVFIIPLHNPTVKELGIKDFTQMSLSNTFITFNSYLVVKQKWYESFFVMLLVIIIVILIAAFFFPAALGATPGLLGTNAAVGATIGLTGTAAIVAGALINTLAAMVVAKIITAGSVAIFGEKIGAIVGAVLSFAVTYGASGGTLAANSLLSAQTLLQITSVIANGYAGYTQAEGLEIQTKMEDNQSVYDKAMKDLENLMRSMGLTDDLIFNPIVLTDSVKGKNNFIREGSYVPETVDEFIGRTTMSGSEIVDITLSMVSDYSKFQLTLPKS